MKKSEILEVLISHYSDGNKARFAAMIGIKPQLLSNWIKRDTLDYEQVYRGCPNLSGDWLLSGQGEIERKDSQNDNTTYSDKELLSLCKSLVENYSQHIEAMNKLMSLVKNRVI